MNQILKSVLLLFTAQACVGVNIVLAKGLINHINPIIVLTVRFTVTSVIILCLSLRTPSLKQFFSLTCKDWLIVTCEALGAGVAFNAIMLHGLYYTNANSAGLITSVLPIVVICLSVVLFKQKLTLKITKSVLIAVAGLVLINFSHDNVKASHALLGNFLVMLALIPDSLYYILSKLHPVKLATLNKTLLLNALNLPFLYLIVLFYPNSYWYAISLHDWLLLGIIGITSGLFFIFWQKGIANIDATYSALSTAFMPIATTILAWLILGEGLTFIKFSGMLLVIFAIYYYSRK